MVGPDQVREMAALADHFAVFATTRPDGRVHASLVKAGVLTDPVTGETVCGAVLVGGARKLGLLRASGRASVVFAQGGRWLAVEGAVRLAGPADPLPGLDADGLRKLLRDVFVAAGGTHEDWDGYDRAMAEEGRTAVLITLDPRE